MTVTGQSSLFLFLLGFLFAARRTGSGRMTKTSNKAVFGRNFSNIISYVNLGQKMTLIFMKREMPILFPLNCERTNLFSVKCDLDPLLPPSCTSYLGFPLQQKKKRS